MRLLRSFWLGLFLLTAAAGRAQTFVDYQVTGGSGSKNNAGSLIGQSFTTNASATAISSLNLFVNRNLLADANFTLSLYATSGSAGAYVPSGGALFSQTFSNTILSESTGTSYTFSGLNWSVAGSTTYLVAVESSVAAAIKWTVNTGTGGDVASLISGTSGQNRYFSSGSPGAGTLFAMTATTTSIPEPSTYAALAGAAAMSLALLRRRRAG